MAQELKVGIIGAGYAGMAAAVDLAARNIPVTVFESARQLGGRARGVLHQDTQLDNGQHLLLGCYHDTLRLIEQVGGNLQQDFLRLPLQLDLHDEFVFRAPHLPAPLHLLIALFSAQGVSFRERLQAARFMMKLRNMNFCLAHDLTVTELLAQHQQSHHLTTKLWEPLCIAALNTPIQKASAQILLNVLRDALNQSRADSDMLLPRIDLTSLFPQRAATYIEQRNGKVHTSCSIEAITPTADSISLVTAQATHHFTHVICATSPGISAKLLHNIPQLQNTVAQIAALKHQPIYTLYLQYPAHITLPHPMLGLYQCDSQWLFDKGKIAGQYGLIAAVISAEGLHQALSQDELAKRVIDELRVKFNINAAPHWFKVIAEKRATFNCAPNLQRPMQKTALPHLLLAGDYTAGDYPATLEGAVQSGLRCAALIAQHEINSLH